MRRYTSAGTGVAAGRPVVQDGTTKTKINLSDGTSVPVGIVANESGSDTWLVETEPGALVDVYTPLTHGTDYWAGASGTITSSDPGGGTEDPTYLGRGDGEKLRLWMPHNRGRTDGAGDVTSTTMNDFTASAALSFSGTPATLAAGQTTYADCPAGVATAAQATVIVTCEWGVTATADTVVRIYTSHDGTNFTTTERIIKSIPYAASTPKRVAIDVAGLGAKYIRVAVTSGEGAAAVAISGTVQYQPQKGS